jgi:hypothetical protein
MTDTGIRGLSDMTRCFGFAQRVNASSHRDTDLGVRGWTPLERAKFQLFIEWRADRSKICPQYVRCASAIFEQWRAARSPAVDDMWPDCRSWPALE